MAYISRYTPPFMQSKLKRTYSVKKERSQKNTFSGVVEAPEFSRLAESVVSINDAIEVSFRIFDGYAELPEFKGHYKAIVALQCQRCLSDLEAVIEEDFHFYIGRENQLEDDSAGYEVVETVDGDLLDVVSVIEDDIILNLPLIPAHKTDCNEYLLELNRQADNEPKEIKKNPFAVLEGLKTDLKH